jgi:hypothetical protein
MKNNSTHIDLTITNPFNTIFIVNNMNMMIVSMWFHITEGSQNSFGVRITT